MWDSCVPELSPVSHHDRHRECAIGAGRTRRARRQRQAKEHAKFWRASGMADKLNSLPRQLSGGEQQRVAIARAIVAGPSAVLADEPTAALDGATGRAIMELLATIAKDRDRTVFVVSHDARLASFADIIISIEDGRIVEERPKAKIQHLRTAGERILAVANAFTQSSKMNPAPSDLAISRRRFGGPPITRDRGAHRSKFPMTASETSNERIRCEGAGSHITDGARSSGAEPKTHPPNIPATVTNIVAVDSHPKTRSQPLMVNLPITRRSAVINIMTIIRGTATISIDDGGPEQCLDRVDRAKRNRHPDCRRGSNSEIEPLLLLVAWRGRPAIGVLRQCRKLPRLQEPERPAAQYRLCQVRTA